MGTRTARTKRLVAMLQLGGGGGAGGVRGMETARKWDGEIRIKKKGAWHARWNRIQDVISEECVYVCVCVCVCYCAIL